MYWRILFQGPRLLSSRWAPTPIMNHHYDDQRPPFPFPSVGPTIPVLSMLTKWPRTRELHRQICRRIIIIQCLWFLPVMHKWWLASKRREDIHPGWSGESVFMLKYMETIKLHGSLQRCLASYFCTLMRNPTKQCYIGHTWFHKKYQLSCFAWLLFFPITLQLPSRSCNPNLLYFYCLPGSEQVHWLKERDDQPK